MYQVLKRAVWIALGAGVLAACTTYVPFEGQSEPARPAYPVRLAEAQPQPVARAPVAPPPAAPPAEETGPFAAPAGAIEGRPLAAAASPPGNQPAYITPSTPPEPAFAQAPTPAPAPVQAPAPRPPVAAPPPAATPAPRPAPPRMRTVTRTSVTGKLVEVDGPQITYTVEKGDNLDAIGRKLGLERKVLAELNDLKEPYLLRPGQVLKGPPSRRKAYVVVSGDTLSAIGRRFNVTTRDLETENEMKPGATLRPGQKIRLPEGYQDDGPLKSTSRVPVEEPAEPPPSPTRPVPVAAPPAQAAPPRPPAAPPATTPARAPVAPPRSNATPTAPTPAVPPPAATPSAPVVIPSTAPPSDVQIADLGRGRFLWPVRGDIVSTFGPKGQGQRNDGVNIRSPSGDPVRAAAAGEVVYAGDQVPGFGNLVLVKHADGWVTAYGHLARTDVKMQETVSQGQQLGQVGATGGVGEPQLHFEVRYAPTPADRARPIDPMLVLPK